MFKENVRQPLVVRKGETVGVINFMRIFSDYWRWRVRSAMSIGRAEFSLDKESLRELIWILP
jgi:hypothetical protein